MVLDNVQVYDEIAINMETMGLVLGRDRLNVNQDEIYWY